MLRSKQALKTSQCGKKSSTKQLRTHTSAKHRSRPLRTTQKRHTASRSKAPVPGEPFTSNISPAIENKIGVDLHRKESHPICTIKHIIFDHFNTHYRDNNNQPIFKQYDNFYPEVTTKANFDELLTPADHPSRSISDTFYRTPELVLRPHTSAHQTQLLRQGDNAFLVAGDCYRRDEIDASHYPVFHQMEGVRVFRKDELPEDPDEQIKFITNDLKQALEGVARRLFGDTEMRWIDAYFPFTNPSFELEVLYNGKWLECLGCGMTQHKIMSVSGREGEQAWAFGLGLDRLAMVLFEVPDIRLFWSQDPRFQDQFKQGEITKFQPFSKYPATFRDMSFWYDPDQFHDNDFFAVARECAADCVENVELMDSFVHPKSGRHSKMFRVHYRSLERTLTTEEVNDWQESLRKIIGDIPSVELR